MNHDYPRKQIEKVNNKQFPKLCRKQKHPLAFEFQAKPLQDFIIITGAI